jgi:hypothetical protein
MKRLTLRNIICYLSVFVIMAIAATQIGFGTFYTSAASCCGFGVDCSKTTTCCQAYSGQAACSVSKAGYCRRICGVLPD